MAVTYGGYLALDELLTLQRPRSAGPEHDEMLFIVIHQVYELWFKQLLHEVGHCQTALEASDRPVAMADLKRILTILKILVAQIDVLETMTPVSFDSFRDRLDTASGFESYQFRELEFALGARRPKMVAHYAEVGRGDRLAERLRTPSLYDSFLRHLAAAGHPVPREVLERDFAAPNPEHPAVRRILVGIYHGDPGTRDLCERLVDLDEGFQEWRYRHVKMVERTIGTRRGTGGSAGAEYLRRTLFQALFPDLWTIRTEL